MPVRPLFTAFAGFTALAFGTARLSAAESPENPIFSRIAPMKADSGFRQDDYWVWCSSVVKGDDGKFHMYASRWMKAMPMHPGWMVGSEIVHCVSDNAEGPYRFSDVALGPRGPEYWDGCSQHNPRVLRVGDEYVLFYMGSTNPLDDARQHPELVTLSSPYARVGRSNKRIGVAVAKSPSGPWKRFDRPILETKPGTFYSYLTSNPTPYIAPDGKVTLVFKSRRHTPNPPYYSDMMLGLATAPNYAGPYTVIGDKPIFGAGSGNPNEVEDPFIWKDAKGFHMLAKDHQGKITGQRGFGVLSHSDDAYHWKLDPAPLAYSKTFTQTDGKKITLGQVERPGGIFDENGVLTHLTFAVMDGAGGFDGGQNTWNIVVPLKPATP